MDYKKASLEKHFEWKGKLEVVSRAKVENKQDLSLAYTPGVAAPCLAIQADESLSYELTRKWNTVAVVTDGSAVLGLGNIGHKAGMPVMEGKCVLFREFAGNSYLHKVAKRGRHSINNLQYQRQFRRHKSRRHIRSEMF